MPFYGKAERKVCLTVLSHETAIWFSNAQDAVQNGRTSLRNPERMP